MARQILLNDSGTPDGTTWKSGAVKETYIFTYDFSINGGAIGSIQLTQNSGSLPDKFVVQNVTIDMITALGSSGASTSAITTGQGAGDLVAATLVVSAPFSTIGQKATLVLPATASSFIKTTASRSPSLVVAVANLNAGKFKLFVEGFQSE